MLEMVPFKQKMLCSGCAVILFITPEKLSIRFGSFLFIDRIFF
ncbi:hypothetical protein ANACAC_00081 [Anaerostipes caccae L1-92]|uniref:Uncharacterized protein n=1 Tax=Anaerostipes caccae (strain DSM 14662 / CCUG 47493 / JCM 13470 / NCIMB 13811 / L1-92) TaxID=411490 RepID=B0M954_ANACD|nr:hypothetical protein ANACAC_00081 [Anaerostipes caccae L1-92]